MGAALRHLAAAISHWFLRSYRPGGRLLARAWDAYFCHKRKPPKKAF
jgi:hypothetical protein